MGCYLQIIFMKRFCLAFIVIIWSCDSRRGSNYLNYDEFIVDSVSLKLDNSTSLDFYYIHTFNEYLVSLNQITNSIDKYSLETGELVKRIEFPVNGPEGITGVLQGFTYHNPDSIFVFIKGKLNGGILFNENGEFLDRIRHTDVQSEARTLINHASTGGNPTIKIGDKLHFMRYPLFDTYNPSNINDLYPLSLIYDLNSNELIFDSLITFPEYYHDEIWSIFDLTFSRAINDKSQSILSWPLLEHLLLYDPNSKNIVVKDAKSKFHQNSTKPFPGTPRPDLPDKTTLSNIRYRSILFDPYRKLYYRIAVLPLKDVEGKQYFPNSYEQEFSIIVLDQDFKKLKEVFFPGKTYNFFNVKVSKQGVILLRNNEFDETLNEDLLKIDIFDLSK